MGSLLVRLIQMIPASRLVAFGQQLSTKLGVMFNFRTTGEAIASIRQAIMNDPAKGLLVASTVASFAPSMWDLFNDEDDARSQIVEDILPESELQNPNSQVRTMLMTAATAVINMDAVSRVTGDGDPSTLHGKDPDVLRHAGSAIQESINRVNDAISLWGSLERFERAQRAVLNIEPGDIEIFKQFGR